MTQPSPSPVSDRIMTIPNQITAVRLILPIVVFALIGQQWFFTAMIVFLVAAATDWVDGYWARKFSQVSKLGRVFDPFVDKIIICIQWCYERESYESFQDCRCAPISNSQHIKVT